MTNLSLLSLCIIFTIFISSSNAISQCNGPCKTQDDCDGELICINGKCSDDPNVGTNNCKNNRPSVPSSTTDTCEPCGSMVCNGTRLLYNCSPPISASTPAQLTHNDFSDGGDGGGPGACEGKYYDNNESIVALSTGWFAGSSRCGKMIRIQANNGNTAMAKVVDECDSTAGCDAQHGDQPPCENNVVDGSIAVWNALELDTDEGVEEVTGGEHQYIGCIPLQLSCPDGRQLLFRGELCLHMLVPTSGSSLHFPLMQINWPSQ
ncbi:kiwellin-like isoform X2 [Lycium barbarum]|uniref:kiwellin-like isoform X2 n=1 Tax=Lycium barbarum TaxID=112863 RepID=UPI00293E3D47|nr:kiwellin-like isoform X2 [Lycium barbarum]